MKELVIGRKQYVADWVSKQMGCSRWTSDFEAFGIVCYGVIVAGVVVDGYVKGARCSVHCAGTGKYWLNRELLQAVFRYVFVQLGCKVIVNPVSSSNAASLRFTEHIGFTEVCRIEGGCPDGDLVIFKMPKADCRWLECLK